jgi:putative glutamine amidotransferase
MHRITIGLSYRGPFAAYDRYPIALQNEGKALDIDVDARWLSMKDGQLDRELLERVDGVVFTGGCDVEPERYGKPELRDACFEIQEQRDEFEWEIARRADERKLPMLGVCRGMQLLNVFYGGTLIAHLPNTLDHRMPNGDGFAAHALRVAPGTALAAAAGEATNVNSSHHQAVDELAASFHAIAWAPDGIVEAYERRPNTAADAGTAAEPFLFAVQWHPEAMPPDAPPAAYPLQAFLQAVVSAAVSSPS